MLEANIVEKAMREVCQEWKLLERVRKIREWERKYNERIKVLPAKKIEVTMKELIRKVWLKEQARIVKRLEDIRGILEELENINILTNTQGGTTR